MLLTRDVRLGVGVIGKSQQQTRLSYTRVTDEEELWIGPGFGDGSSVRLFAVFKEPALISRPMQRNSP